MDLLLAWRNIWRNPRRTAVILAAIIVGVWSMIFLGALMRGAAIAMVKNNISTMIGHIQIHDQGYHRDPVIEYSMSDPKQVETVLNEVLPRDAHWAPRVRVNAVANNARHSAGVTFVGIDPEKEAKVSFIGSAPLEGEYLQPGDERGIVIGRALLEKFETRIGHKLVMMSQDTTKSIASRAFRIIGVYDAELEATEKQFVFVNLSAARKMLKMEGELSEFCILLADEKQSDPIAETLRQKLPETYEVMTWLKIQPFLDAYLKIFNGFMTLWYIVVFIAMGFGIVNTTLMAVMERMREFGLLKALGMKPRRIVGEVLSEAFFLLIIGLIIGNILGLFSVWLLRGGIDLSAWAAGLEFAGMTRIIYPAVVSRDISQANIVVFGLGLLVSLYPAIKAARFTPVEAMTQT